MVGDRPDDVFSPEANRARRPPPTLDLSATEGPRPDVSATVDADAEDPAMRSAPPNRGGLSLFTTALSGAVGAALMMLVAWFGMRVWMPAASAPQPASQTIGDADDIAGRLAKLEARPAPVLPAAPNLSAINARLDALDKSAAGSRDETMALRAQSQQALTVANEAKADAAAKAPPSPNAAAALPVDLSEINMRLAQLEAVAKAQSDRLAALAPKPANDLAARRVAAAALLDAQVRQGEPYAAALAAAKSLAPDAAKLAPLDAYAATGISDAATLSRALLDMRQIVPPSSATSGGIIDRLRSGAARLVTIERIDAPPAQNAAFARAAEAARRNDVTAAARELAESPPAERAAMQPWLDRVTARDAARAAARQFADEALAAFPKP